MCKAQWQTKALFAIVAHTEYAWSLPLLHLGEEIVKNLQKNEVPAMYIEYK